MAEYKALTSTLLFDSRKLTTACSYPLFPTDAQIKRQSRARTSTQLAARGQQLTAIFK